MDNDKPNNTGILDENVNRLTSLINDMNTSFQQNSLNSDALNQIGSQSLTSKFDKLNTIHEMDVSLIKKDLETIDKEMEDFEEKLEAYNEKNSDANERLNDDYQKLNEKYQELKGEINQLRLIIDNLKSEVAAKNENKSSMVNNLLYPILVAIIIGVLGILCSVVYKSSLNDYHYNNVQFERK